MTLQARAALLHLMPDSVGAVVSPASCHAEIHDEDGCYQRAGGGRCGSRSPTGTRAAGRHPGRSAASSRAHSTCICRVGHPWGAVTVLRKSWVAVQQREPRANPCRFRNEDKCTVVGQGGGLPRAGSRRRASRHRAHASASPASRRSAPPQPGRRSSAGLPSSIMTAVPMARIARRPYVAGVLFRS